MKKFISLLMAVLMIMSVATVAFAAPGSYKEEAANSYVFLKCEKCSSCTGKFGCECCEACPGYMGEDGVPDNLGEYLDCRFGFYYDIDVYKYNPDGSIKTKADGTYDLEHEGTFKMRYYWKTPCCGECTGKKGCQCNNTDFKDSCGCVCCTYTPDHTEEQIQEGLETGRQGFASGIQTALIAIRDVMYDLFNKLFEFLRIDVILGKDRVPTTSK